VRILLAIDGSNDAKAAVAWLKHLPLPADQDVRVLTVVVPPMAFGNVDNAAEVLAALAADARRLVDDTTSAQRLSGAMSGDVVEGEPRDAIVAAARDCA
jgi:hypothetical protein